MLVGVRCLEHMNVRRRWKVASTTHLHTASIVINTDELITTNYLRACVAMRHTIWVGG